MQEGPGKRVVDRKDIETLIGHLEIAGVRLWEEGGQLHFRAPAGALPVEARATLAESREEVISILRRRPRFAVGRSEDAGISAFPGDAGDNRDDRAVAQLMAELEKRRVVLSADGERLKISAPKGALTEDLKRQVISLKSAVIAALSRAPRQWAIPTRNLPPVADRSRPLPLSHMQQRLWFLKQLDPGNTAFSIPCAIRFRGNLLIDIVEKAFQFLVQRHESLRMRFSAQEGVPACHVDPCLGIRVFEKDLRDCSKDTVESELRSELAAHISVPFELANGPLWRVQLLRVSNEDCVLSLVFDHIIIDGISLGILLEEFRYTYTQLARGAAIELPELKAQYVDLVAIDRDRLQGEWLEQHLRFWKAELADLPEALQLPTDRPRPAVQTYRGAREERILIPGLPQRLRSVARELKLTPFVILLAAFQEMLHRYAGVDDLAVGTAVANRDSANSEGVVGFFANNVVLRGDLVGNPTVLEFLRKTRDRYVRCMDHQAMPFDLLVDTLVKRRNTDHSPLFQVMFVLQGWARPHVELPGAVGELVVLPTQTSRYDLAADVFESQEGIGIFFEYNTDLFDASTIRRMLHHYERLLQQMLERPEARLNDLDLLDAAEQHQLVTSWNDTATDYPRGRTLHELFQEQAKRTPEVIALVYEGESLSYAELNQRANRLAHHLHKLGVGARSLVGVFLERSIDMVVAVLGALKAGAAYVPLDPAFPRDRIDFMINDAALAVIVTTDGLAPTLEPGAHVLVRLDADAELIALASTGNLPATSRPMDLAYVIYTSGSTGRPKGVMIEHRAVVNFLSAMHRQPGITQGDRFVAVTTLSFDIAGLEIHGPLTTGATVVLAPRASVVDGVALAALLDHSEATILQATPSTWRLLLDSGWNGRQGLRMLCGGENLPRELAG